MRGLILAVAIIIVLVTSAGGFSLKEKSTEPKLANLIGEDADTVNKDSLQLRTLKFGEAPPSIPNPSVTPEPSSSPAPSCETQKVAVDLLLDTSGSMCLPGGTSPCNNPPAGSKIVALKTAVTQFVSNLKPDDVIGIQEFNTNAANLVTPDLVSNNSSLVNSKISGLWGSGLTYTKDGFAIAKQQIDSRRAAFPDHNWVLIFLSDGVPQTEFEEVPSVTQHPGNIPDQIKQSDVRIFSIGLNLNVYTGTGLEYAQNLMKTIASSPQNANFYEAPTASQLSQIYQDISSKICR